MNGDTGIYQELAEGQTVGSVLSNGRETSTGGFLSRNTVDHESLAKAIRCSVRHAGMRPDDAWTIASHVLNFFGYHEWIIDNVLEPDDRDTFYMLEDTGILETERDETTLYDGREWRIHYWMFCKERIFELAEEERKIMAGKASSTSGHSSTRRIESHSAPRHPTTAPPENPIAYHDLSEEIWLERKYAPAPELGQETDSSPSSSHRSRKKK